MIRHTRTAVIAGGNSREALQFAGKVTALVNGRYPELGLRWGVQIGGTVGVVHWTMDVPDLETIGRLSRELLADAEYTGMVDAAGHCWVPGKTHDAIVSLAE